MGLARKEFRRTGPQELFVRVLSENPRSFLLFLRALELLHAESYGSFGVLFEAPCIYCRPPGAPGGGPGRRGLGGA